MKKYIIILAFIFVALISFEVQADRRILDGDSIRFNRREEFRLVGIDAPEYKQMCYSSEGTEYDCGEAAKKALMKIVNNGYINCNKDKKDRYNRYLSECYVGSVNLNEEMLRQGWAITYRTKKQNFLKAEEYAKENKKGMWQGKFMKPELYRALKRK